MDDKTLQALTALAVKLGTTAEYLWGVLLKQALVTGVTQAALILAAIAACVFAAWLLRRMDPWPDDSEPHVAAWGVFWVITVMVVGVCILKFTETVTALVNPEFWALQQILRAL